VQSDFPNTDLQEVYENKIKRVQACIDTRGHYFQHLLQTHSDLLNALLFRVRVRSPSYPASKEHETNDIFICGQSGSTLFYKWHYFGKYVVEHKMLLRFL
jgi:hypothetical protein